MKCPAPLPENTAEPLLMRMLVPAPYQAPVNKEKKKKGKEAEDGLHHKGTSGAMSRGTEVRVGASGVCSGRAGVLLAVRRQAKEEGGRSQPLEGDPRQV